MLLVLLGIPLPVLDHNASPIIYLTLLKRWPDLRLLLTSVLDQQPWKFDSKVVPLPWRFDEEGAIKSKLHSGGLTVGFFKCDGNVR